MMGGTLESERQVFVDETGSNKSLSPVYAWFKRGNAASEHAHYTPKGERLRLSVPRSRGKNTTLLSSITIEGMGRRWP